MSQDTQNIAIIGVGYVGLANALLFATQHNVRVFDLSKDKLDRLAAKQSPIKDNLISNYLTQEHLNLEVSYQLQQCIEKANFIIIATPTDYDPQTNFFNTFSITSTLEQLAKAQTTATIVIKSTIPIGFTHKVREQYPELDIYFSPEFLREGRALEDNLYPSRIIVGGKTEQARKFAELLAQGAKKENVPILLTNSQEAEAIKLFANTYLAMRVAFFNELDTFAQSKDLNTAELIEGVGLDPRIGLHYANPSFGYGGYCLPKDTKQLLANYEQLPQQLIHAIVASNNTRKRFIAKDIIEKAYQLYKSFTENTEQAALQVDQQVLSYSKGLNEENVTSLTSKPRIGIYQLRMKTGSDNFRSSAIQDIILYLQEYDVELQIYEPLASDETFLGVEITKDLVSFKANNDLIVANRIDDNLSNVLTKVYTRDFYHKD